MTSTQQGGSPAVDAMLRFITWLIPTLDQFPRSQKFLLGDRIQSLALDVLERLLEAVYTRDRASLLQAANLGLEKMRILLRIAKDLRHLDARRHEFAVRSLDEIGRRVGARRRAHAQRDVEQGP